MRIIIHIDLDAFYASAEAVRQPALRGKPIVVCMFSGRGDSGAVATASYEARKLGIRSGQSLRTARARADTETVFLPADRGYYRKVSERVMNLFRQHAETFEQRSIDEACMDVSPAGSYQRAAAIVKAIKKELLRQEGLTCSVGIGPNKLVAKMASKEQKPDGLTIARSFRRFHGKPVGKLFGIGPKTLRSLKNIGVQSIRDLAVCKKEKLQELFGENKGSLLHEHANGRDNEPVTALIRQQLSRIGTLSEDTTDTKKIIAKLSSLTADLHKNSQKEGIWFRTITFIAINTRLDAKTRSVTLPVHVNRKSDILSSIRTLLNSYMKENPGTLRRVGVRISSFEHAKKESGQRNLAEF